MKEIRAGEYSKSLTEVGHSKGGRYLVNYEESELAMSQKVEPYSGFGFVIQKCR